MTRRLIPHHSEIDFGYSRAGGATFCYRGNHGYRRAREKHHPVAEYRMAGDRGRADDGQGTLSRLYRAVDGDRAGLLVSRAVVLRSRARSRGRFGWHDRHLCDQPRRHVRRRAARAIPRAAIRRPCRHRRRLEAGRLFLHPRLGRRRLCQPKVDGSTAPGASREPQPCWARTAPASGPPCRRGRRQP